MISCFKGKFKVTSPRGYRILSGVREYHGGLDLVALGQDKSIYAIADGTVDAVPYEANGFGYYVRQKLPDGKRIYYGHMTKGSVCVKAGQQIKVGDKLGIMGSTGRSTAPHCHIELRIPGVTKESLDISEFTGIPNKLGTYECATRQPLSTGNDIIWELMHGKYNIPITEVDKAVKALDKAKENSAFCSLYWILYKLVNGTT